MVNSQNLLETLIGKTEIKKQEVADKLLALSSTESNKQRQIVFDKQSGEFKEIQRGTKADNQVIVCLENLPALEEHSI